MFNLTSYYIYTMIYLLFSICVIYPPTEFISAGVTVPTLFSKFLGNEHEQFVKYHIKKSCLYLFIYSVLPLGYILSSYLLGYATELTELFSSDTAFWQLFTMSSCVFPCLSLYQILNWTRNGYENHPIALNLAKFSSGNGSWKDVASNVDTDFRRVYKIILQSSAIVKIVATENWILKVTPLTMFVIHQSDASLIVKHAQTYQVSQFETQYLNIEVKSGRRGVEAFMIRINSSDFKDLKDIVARTITIMPHVKFHQSVIDQFVDVFKETVKNNPLYKCNQDVERCIGCLFARPNVKIQKLCQDMTSDPTKCEVCYCKPMWCVECMAKWFASRQDADQQNKWLSSKCTCPMCRATFCLLDVCFLEQDINEE